MKRIPLSDIDYGAEEEAAILRVLQRRWLSLGPEVEAFESEMAALLRVSHAIAVSSGTAALHLAYLALGIGPTDEVIQPATNFVAAANMTVAVGATPVFADIVGLDTPTIDPNAVETLITPRTKAVVAMHYGGYACRMTELLDLCQRHGLALIEDACHAIGARYVDPDSRAPHGLHLGAVGDIGCFSFFSNKNLAIGEGGLLVTNRKDLAERVRRLRSHGMTSLSWDRHQGHASGYDVVVHGHNYRLDDLHAALGRCQLRKLAANNERRAALVQAYRERMGLVDGWVMPFERYKGESSYHLCVAVAPDSERRRRVVLHLDSVGVQTSLHYPSVTQFTAFKGASRSDLVHAKTFGERAVSLPLFPTMSLKDVEDVCGAVAASDAVRVSV